MKMTEKYNLEITPYTKDCLKALSILFDEQDLDKIIQILFDNFKDKLKEDLQND